MFYKSLPVFKEYLWAGSRLKSKYGKKSDLDKISESFEFSLNDLGLSSLEAIDKEVLLRDYMSYANTGDNLKKKEAKMLIKLLDSDDDLSVQVHPSDDYAMEHYQKLGKTEMWYIVEASPDAFIYLGFNKDYTEEEVKQALNDGTILNLLNKYSVKAGEFYMIPSGTIHAMGKGLTIYEIQENSDLTFRLFDYNRIDKDGKKRELHIDEALEVLNYQKYTPLSMNQSERSSFNVLTANHYFELLKLEVMKYFTIRNNAKSFALITIVEGNPKLNGIEAHLGDSYYIDPEMDIKVEGHAVILLARVPDLALGLDVGGTSIKGAIIDDLGYKVAESKVQTESDKGADQVIANMAKSVKLLSRLINVNPTSFNAIGVGFPGNIETKTGMCILSNNLGIKQYNIKTALEKVIGTKVIIDNDANCAALGEHYFTEQKKYHDMTLITLGTGVGSGFILGGKLFRGGQGSTTEIGHVKVKSDSFLCTCGQYGCLESLISLARIKHDVDKLRLDESNGLKELISDEDSSVKIFSLASKNMAAKEFVRRYLNNLLLGLIAVANMLQPEIIVIGGGLSYQIASYIPVLEKRLNRVKFGGMDAPYIKIIQAILGNDAGAFGAAALTKTEEQSV